MDYQYESADELFEKRAKDRQNSAKLPFDEKLQILVRIQRMNYAMKKAAGRDAPRPWCMSEDEYKHDEPSGHEI
jgi:hypothetical protein